MTSALCQVCSVIQFLRAKNFIDMKFTNCWGLWWDCDAMIYDLEMVQNVIKGKNKLKQWQRTKLNNDSYIG